MPVTSAERRRPERTKPAERTNWSVYVHHWANRGGIRRPLLGSRGKRVCSPVYVHYWANRRGIRAGIAILCRAVFPRRPRAGIALGRDDPIWSLECATTHWGVAGWLGMGGGCQNLFSGRRFRCSEIAKLLGSRETKHFRHRIGSRNGSRNASESERRAILVARDGKEGGRAFFLLPAPPPSQPAQPRARHSLSGAPQNPGNLASVGRNSRSGLALPPAGGSAPANPPLLP